MAILSALVGHVTPDNRCSGAVQRGAPDPGFFAAQPWAQLGRPTRLVRVRLYPLSGTGRRLGTAAVVYRGRHPLRA